MAVAATLANGMVVETARAVDVPRLDWVSGDVTINPGTVVRDATVAVSAAGLTLGTLSSGTITAFDGILTPNVSGTTDQITTTSTGVIQGTSTGINLYGGTINSIRNSGEISGAYAGIANGGVIGELINADISASGYSGSFSSRALVNSATLTSLTNEGLIIGAQFAINNTGSLGVITNSGTIAGNIQNDSSHLLIINGGSGSSFGVLAGSNLQTPGPLFSRNADVQFNAGKLWLNSDINLGGSLQSVVNNGAMLQRSNSIYIIGNYTQAAGAGLELLKTVKQLTSQGLPFQSRGRRCERDPNDSV